MGLIDLAVNNGLILVFFSKLRMIGMREGRGPG